MFPKRCMRPPWRNMHVTRSAIWGAFGRKPCSNAKRSYWLVRAAICRTSALPCSSRDMTSTYSRNCGLEASACCDPSGTLRSRNAATFAAMRRYVTHGVPLGFGASPMGRNMRKGSPGAERPLARPGKA